jgi:hypothetical protein
MFSFLFRQFKNFNFYLSNMTPTDDWPQVESMESSTDLFAGDILGDELIDIYNAAVVGGSEDEAMNG